MPNSNDLLNYQKDFTATEQEVCSRLCALINEHLTEAESKIWHTHPVWFINGNPIVGYSKQKLGIRLMFWSGLDFMQGPNVVFGKKFKDASIFYHSITDIKEDELQSWLHSSRELQWDYKNIVKRKGKLERIS